MAISEHNDYTRLHECSSCEYTLHEDLFYFGVDQRGNRKGIFSHCEKCMIAEDRWRRIKRVFNIRKWWYRLWRL